MVSGRPELAGAQPLQISGRPHYFKFSLGENLGMYRQKWTWQPRGADSGMGEGEGRREESSTLKARGQLNQERPARQVWVCGGGRDGS